MGSAVVIRLFQHILILQKFQTCHIRFLFLCQRDVLGVGIFQFIIRSGILGDKGRKRKAAINRKQEKGTEHHCKTLSVVVAIIPDMKKRHHKKQQRHCYRSVPFVLSAQFQKFRSGFFFRSFFHSRVDLLLPVSTYVI